MVKARFRLIQPGASEAMQVNAWVPVESFLVIQFSLNGDMMLAGGTTADGETVLLARSTSEKDFSVGALLTVV